MRRHVTGKFGKIVGAAALLSVCGIILLNGDAVSAFLGSSSSIAGIILLN